MVPATDSSAGTNVSAATTLISGMSSPVNPILRRNGTGRAISAARLTATVMPENSTARPAVARVCSTACSPSYPLPRASRHRVTIRSA
ncbi:Uncharacterised protein [Mycobacteroides abscessus subsp. abscessus]|nr:Uncharacterised protein [Mycobacteroides abscessus subsp. abscessus]